MKSNLRPFSMRPLAISEAIDVVSLNIDTSALFWLTVLGYPHTTENPQVGMDRPQRTRQDPSSLVRKEFRIEINDEVYYSNHVRHRDG